MTCRYFVRTFQYQCVSPTLPVVPILNYIFCYLLTSYFWSFVSYFFKFLPSQTLVNSSQPNSASAIPWTPGKKKVSTFELKKKQQETPAAFCKLNHDFWNISQGFIIFQQSGTLRKIAVNNTHRLHIFFLFSMHSTVSAKKLARDKKLARFFTRLLWHEAETF